MPSGTFAHCLTPVTPPALPHPPIPRYLTAPIGATTTPSPTHAPELCLVYKETLIADGIYAMSEPREGVANTVIMVLAYLVFTLALACGLLFSHFRDDKLRLRVAK